jgi:isopenicillin-N N-acyltransferase like protein
MRRHPISQACNARKFFAALLFFGLIFALQAGIAGAQTVARCGQGWLEKIDGYPVLHLKGSPYEMGYQHGALLKESVGENMHNIVGILAAESFHLGPLTLKPRPLVDSLVEQQRQFVPPKYFEELHGLAAGAGVPLADVQAGNFLPELFHCSGFAVMNSATTDGTLYHGRVLDYKCDWHLQDHAVLIVAEPDGGIPFVNVTYAGFIGSVTGMNAKHVSIGEMGGSGQGHWQGMPMALLVREVLQRAGDVDAALAIFRNNPRTCQYFYVIADGNTNRAVGVQTTWDMMKVVQPGEADPMLPKPVKDCVLLSAGKRYDELVKRAQAAHGKLDAEGARHLMDEGVAMKSNLHDVLFAPASTKFWVANASPDGKPAADQPYQAFQLTELLARKPDTAAKAIPLVAATSERQGASRRSTAETTANR